LGTGMGWVRKRQRTWPGIDSKCAAWRSGLR
jgi:hypothetical protein